MDALGMILAAEQIRSLKARYFRLQDNKDWSAYAELFLEDSAFDVSEAMADPLEGGAGLAAERSEPIIGRDAIVAYVSSGLNEKVRSFHEGFMPEIEILSDAAARAVWPMEDRLWFLDGPIREMHGYGYYHETYTCRDGRWYIQTLKITRAKVDFVRR